MLTRAEAWRRYMVLLDVLDALVELVTQASAKLCGGRRRSTVELSERKKSLTALVSRETAKIATGGLQRRATGERTRRRRSSAVGVHHGRDELEELERLQAIIARRCFWILLLGTRDHAQIQLHVCDRLSVFLAYVPRDEVAVSCLTHALGTNLEVQERLVGEAEARLVLDMVRESRMQALYQSCVGTCLSHDSSTRAEEHLVQL